MRAFHFIPKCLGVTIAAALICLPVFVYGAQMGFVKSNIWASKVNVIVDENITIYAILVNGEKENLEGKVIFLDDTNGETVGEQKTFTLPGDGSSSVLSATWKAKVGDHRFRAKIIDGIRVDRTGVRTPMGSEILSELTDIVSVKVDSDHDGVTDDQENHDGSNPNNPDTDGDGVNDNRDPNPTNPDTDGDGDHDGTDPAPTNPSVFTPPDTDRDGTPDSKDSDKDNDGIYNWIEEKNGTNPLKYDTDGDKVGDKDDAFPLDAKKWKKVSTVLTTENTSEDTIEEMPIEEDITSEEEMTGMVLGEKITNEPSQKTSWNLPWWLSSWWVISLFILWILLLILFIIFYTKKRMANKEFQERSDQLP